MKFNLIDDCNFPRLHQTFNGRVNNQLIGLQSDQMKSLVSFAQFSIKGHDEAMWCTFKSDCNLWVTSVYMFSSNCSNFPLLSQLRSRMDTGTIYSASLFTFDRFTRKVFSVSSLSWLLWWSSSLCSIPMGIFPFLLQLQQMRPSLRLLQLRSCDLFIFTFSSSSFYSFSSSPTNESHRQNVANHWTYGAVIRKSLATSNGAWEKS